jgi:hypothetical protein
MQAHCLSHERLSELFDRLRHAQQSLPGEEIFVIPK